MGTNVRIEDKVHPIYSAGDCPVCFDSGAVIVLMRTDTHRSVFLCPLCGVAWNQPPPPTQLHSVASLKELAPNGVALPTAEEARATGLPLVELTYDEWQPLLTPFLEGR